MLDSSDISKCYIKLKWKKICNVLSRTDKFAPIFLDQCTITDTFHRGSMHCAYQMICAQVLGQRIFQALFEYLKARCHVLLEKFKVRLSGMNIEILWVMVLYPQSRKMNHLSRDICTIDKQNIVG